MRFPHQSIIFCTVSTRMPTMVSLMFRMIIQLSLLDWDSPAGCACLQ